jgi:hypothetical protein
MRSYKSSLVRRVHLLRFCGNIHIINVFKEVVFIIYCVCLCFVRRR